MKFWNNLMVSGKKMLGKTMSLDRKWLKTQLYDEILEHLSNKLYDGRCRHLSLLWPFPPETRNKKHRDICWNNWIRRDIMALRSLSSFSRNLGGKDINLILSISFMKWAINHVEEMFVPVFFLSLFSFFFFLSFPDGHKYVVTLSF